MTFIKINFMDGNGIVFIIKPPICWGFIETDSFARHFFSRRLSPFLSHLAVRVTSSTYFHWKAQSCQLLGDKAGTSQRSKNSLSYLRNTRWNANAMPCLVCTVNVPQLLLSIKIGKVFTSIHRKRREAPLDPHPLAQLHHAPSS